MANLTFRSILAAGSKAIKGDFYFKNIALSSFVDLPALLVIAASGVDNADSFITINADATKVSGQTTQEAGAESYFVSRLLTNSTATWIPQFHRVANGKLKDGGNILGIHTREWGGGVYSGDLGPAATHDQINVARIFLMYFGSE